VGIEGPDGTTLVRTPALPLAEVLVSATGFRSVALGDVRTDQRVVLERGPLVHLVLSDPLPVGEAWSAWARPLLLGEDEREHEPAVPFDAAGRATARLSVPGRHWISVVFTRPDRAGFASVDGLDWTIEVADSPAEQTFTAPHFPPEALDGLERFRD
jgi:hypothetical protein